MHFSNFNFIYYMWQYAHKWYVAVSLTLNGHYSIIFMTVSPHTVHDKLLSYLSSTQEILKDPNIAKQKHVRKTYLIQAVRTGSLMQGFCCVTHKCVIKINTGTKYPQHVLTLIVDGPNLICVKLRFLILFILIPRSVAAVSSTESCQQAIMNLCEVSRSKSLPRATYSSWEDVTVTSCVFQSQHFCNKYIGRLRRNVQCIQIQRKHPLYSAAICIP